jgi:hypothetical protein
VEIGAGPQVGQRNEGVGATGGTPGGRGQTDGQDQSDCGGGEDSPATAQYPPPGGAGCGEPGEGGGQEDLFGSERDGWRDAAHEVRRGSRHSQVVSRVRIARLNAGGMEPYPDGAAVVTGAIVSGAQVVPARIVVGSATDVVVKDGRSLRVAARIEAGGTVGERRGVS